MSIKTGTCSAFAATLFGLALTTMPAHAAVEVGYAQLPKPGRGELYRLFGADV